MNPFQPWQDTISLLAGARSIRSARPGERFDTLEKAQKAKRVQKFVQTLATQLLLALRVALG
jgi:hypothetical protein